MDLGMTTNNEELGEGMNKNLEILAKISIDYLIEKKEFEAGKAIGSIVKIGKAAALKNMEDLTIDAIQALEKILQFSIEQDAESTTLKLFLSFGTLGRTAAEQNMEIVTNLAASILGKSVNTAAHRKKEKETIAVIVALGEIGIAAAKVEYPDVSGNTAVCISCLGEIGKLMTQKTLEKAAVGVELELEEMAITAMKENLQIAVGSIVDSIEEVGKSAKDVKMENVVLQAASALQTIMSIAENRYLNDASIAAKVALESFNELDIINDEASIKKIEEIRETMNSFRAINDAKNRIIDNT
jgi:hypothetical protein